MWGGAKITGVSTMPDTAASETVQVDDDVLHPHESAPLGCGNEDTTHRVLGGPLLLETGKVVLRELSGCQFEIVNDGKRAAEETGQGEGGDRVELATFAWRYSSIRRRRYRA
jgi:hypothetical protein